MELTGIDLLGFVAGIIVAASLSMSEPVKLRTLNGVGAVLWVVYGVLIQEIPIVAFNVWICFANAYYLRKALQERTAV